MRVKAACGARAVFVQCLKSMRNLVSCVHIGRACHCSHGHGLPQLFYLRDVEVRHILRGYVLVYDATTHTHKHTRRHIHHYVHIHYEI
jgi:hypothetical protein